MVVNISQTILGNKVKLVCEEVDPMYTLSINVRMTLRVPIFSSPQS